MRSRLPVQLCQHAHQEHDGEHHQPHNHPNLNCRAKHTASSHNSKLSVRKLFHCVQITDNALGFAVSKEHLAVRCLDANALIAPDISAPIADAANPIATKRVPTFHLVALDVIARNRSQSES